MTQLSKFKELCSELGLDTEMALSPSEVDGREFELIVDFESGFHQPQEAIAQVEDKFDFSIYDASVSDYEPSMAGEFVLAVSGTI